MLLRAQAGGIVLDGQVAVLVGSSQGGWCSPTPVQVGDRVRFRSISKLKSLEEFSLDVVDNKAVSNDGVKSNPSQTLSRIRVQILDAGLWTKAFRTQEGCQPGLWNSKGWSCRCFSVRGSNFNAFESRVYRYFGACFGMYLEGSKVEVSG